MPHITDHILTIIGAVATIVFGFVAVGAAIIAFLQLLQNQKKLSFEVQSVTPIVTVHKGFTDKIEIRYGNEAVSNVYLVLIKIINNGRASIVREDYDKQINVSVLSGRLLDVALSMSDPASLTGLIESTSETNVQISKALLNRNDCFILRMLVSDFTGKEEDLKVDGRIAGVKEIHQIKESILLESALQYSPSLLGVVSIAIPGIGPLIAAALGLIIKSSRKRKS